MKPILIMALTVMLNAEQYHPIDEMETFECYAEYGTNCEEAEEYEAEQYEEDREEEEGEDDE